jgi:hypothetical protein
MQRTAHPRGGWDCRYYSPDTDPDIDPVRTADGAAVGLRWDCDGTAITAPMGLRYTDPSRGLEWLAVEWGVWS